MALEISKGSLELNIFKIQRTLEHIFVGNLNGVFKISGIFTPYLRFTNEFWRLAVIGFENKSPVMNFPSLFSF